MKTNNQRRWIVVYCLILFLSAACVGIAQAGAVDWGSMIGGATDATDVNTSSTPATAAGDTGWGAAQAIGTVTIHQVTKNGANVRAIPDQNAEMVGYVPMGTTYLCLGTASNGWREILLPTGVRGYVSGKLVDFSANLNVQTYSTPIGTVAVRVDSLRTYAAASFGSDFMGSIYPGNSYPCVAANVAGAWYCIAVNHGEAGDWVVYVHQDGVQFYPYY